MKRKKVRKKILLLLIFYVTLGLLLLQSLGNTTYQIIQKRIEKKKYSEELTELKDKEEELKSTVTKLQDPDYVARYAREKYLYSKEGEIIIRIPE
ncbi:MAG: septum formation initiator family protein [Bacilli bacterium]|nr:septum formation initiator family protein [Bacilli bacterium]